MAAGRHARITDEMIVDLRRQIGVELETRGQFNELAVADRRLPFPAGP